MGEVDTRSRRTMGLDLKQRNRMTLDAWSRVSAVSYLCADLDRREQLAPAPLHRSLRVPYLNGANMVSPHPLWTIAFRCLQWRHPLGIRRSTWVVLPDAPHSGACSGASPLPAVAFMMTGTGPPAATLVSHLHKRKSGYSMSIERTSSSPSPPTSACRAPSTSSPVRTAASVRVSRCRL
jgi:hypothetical protein